MSLFEDNAEYAYGYLLGQDAVKRQLKAAAAALSERGVAVEACQAYLDKADDAAVSRQVSDALLSALEGDSSAEAAFIRQNKEFLTKKSVWAFGGDGWAYDIGYGGLDHVLASGKDINVLVLDTEVYSNTGGQSSKSTAAGAIAKFSAGGKEVKKKDLGLMAMSYGYVYVAQVAMGADPNQTLKAIREAEAYPGSLHRDLLLSLHRARHESQHGPESAGGEEGRWSAATGTCTGMIPGGSPRARTPSSWTLPRPILTSSWTSSWARTASPL